MSMKYVKLFENWLNEAEGNNKLPDQELPDMSKFEKSLQDAFEQAKAIGVDLAKNETDTDDNKKKEAGKLSTAIIRNFYPRMEWSKDKQVSLKQEEDLKSHTRTIATSQLASNIDFFLFGVIDSQIAAEKRIMNFKEMGKEKDAEQLKTELDSSLKPYFSEMINYYTEDKGKQLLADAYNKTSKELIPQNYADFIGGTKPNERRESPKPLTAPTKVE